MKKSTLLLLVSSAFILSNCGLDEPAEEIPSVYTVSGTITKSDGGVAAGASVMLLKKLDDSDAGQAPANAAGEYIITGVAAGNYKIVITLGGYETGVIDEINIARDLTIDPVELQKITVQTYSIGGAVTVPGGSGAAGVSVQIRTASDNTSVGPETKTNAAGSYSASDVPPGIYNIIFTLEGHETGILSNVAVTDSNLTGQDIALRTIEIDANAVSIIFLATDVAVSNLPADGSITATKSGADLTIASSSGDLVQFYVSGSTTGGSLKIQNNATSPNTLRLTLNSAVIISNSKLPPVQVTKNEGATVIELKGSSILADAASNEENAALISKSGSLEFEGHGSLTISGAAKHAIASSRKTITVRGGNITVPSAISDGFHAEAGFEQSGGSLDVTASGDGIDAGSGTLVINGGDIRVTSATDDAKGVKADAGILVNNGNLNLTVSGAQSKAISSKGNIGIHGGNINILTSGATVLEPVGSGHDPSYCTAIKSDLDVTISGGTLFLQSLAAADGGKGISADGDILISGGDIHITTAGDGKTYTAESGDPDSYTAACIKSDKNITLLGGDITCNSSGTGAKGIAADGAITIGAPGANNANLSLTVGTSGERFLVSGPTGGGQRPGGGFGDNGTDYANPKAIKCEGNMTVNSGAIFINCTQKNDGGEGLESKGALVINGGNIDIHTHDDCINALGITINGGNIFCAASGNDAIDSNATLVVNGGLTIANGVRGDGEAFDAERGFQVNGGTIVGTHGGSGMTTPSGQQRSVRFQGAAGAPVAIKNASGDYLLLFTIPVISGATTSSSLTVTFSSPRLASGAYTLWSGGSITGGITSNGYNTGGAYSGGSSRSFTL
jgi:hypothetical protein